MACKWENNKVNCSNHLCDLPDKNHICYRDYNGLLHNTEGPAVTWKYGEIRYYIHGKLHREDGPALLGYNKRNLWWLNHRQIY